MSAAWSRAAWLLVAVGLVGGTALDELATEPPERRGPWTVLEADLHVHTRFSDGLLSPLGVVAQARRRDLDVIAVTEHNQVLPALLARWFAELWGGPIVLVGQEVTTRDWHVHALGVEQRIAWDQPLDALVDDIHAKGGLAIGAHPFGRFKDSLRTVRGSLDGVELMHPIAFAGAGGPRWSDMLDFYREAVADGFALTPVGTSDYHLASILGILRTLIFVDEVSAGGVLRALAEGRTVVHTLDGVPYGDPALIALLEQEPYPLAEQDYGYVGSGPADRWLRTLGWVGLVGLVLTRRFTPLWRRRGARPAPLSDSLDSR